MKEIIKYFGENHFLPDIITIPSIFMIAFIEILEAFKMKKNGVSNQKIVISTYIISFCFLAEGILFLIPYENKVIDVLCTVFGSTLFIVVLLRYYSKGKYKD